MNKDVIELAIDALEKGVKLLSPFQNVHLLGEQALDQHKTALESLRALQSQYATDGLDDIRGALFSAEYALGRAMQFNCSNPSQKQIEGEALQGVRSALAILDQQAAHNPWQPIETAPRDGTPIWAYLNDTGILKMKFSPETEDYNAAWVEYNEETSDWSPQFWMPYVEPDLNGEG